MPAFPRARQELVAPCPELSIRRQCELVEVSRSGFYYEPTPETEEMTGNALEGVQAQHFWRQNRALSGSLLKVNALSADEVVEEANDLCRHWNDMTRDERRRIAESVIEKPVIGDGEIDITPSYLSGSEELTKSQQRLRGTG